jgi:hypothetical protein
MANIHWKVAVDGNFASADYWNGDQVPLSSDSAFLDVKGGAFTVTSSANQAITALTTIATATLAIANKSTFSVGHGGTAITNAGTISVTGGASCSLVGNVDNTGVISLDLGSLLVGGSTVLTGGGTISLSPESGNVIGNAGSANGRLDNIDNTISGSGQINSYYLINNYGAVINADDAVALTLSKSINNHGLLETTGFGGLTITGRVANVGQIQALGAGALRVHSGSIVNLGTTTVGPAARIDLESGEIAGSLGKTSGLFVASGGAVTALSGANRISTGTVANAGTIGVSNGAALELDGTINNTGVVLINSTGAATTLEDRHGEALTLIGGGKVKLTDNAQNLIGSVDADGAATLTNLDNTISGGGQIGVDDMVLRNLAAGVIDASGATASLTIDTGTTNRDSNFGLIEETGGAGLNLTNTNVANSGTVQAMGTGALTLTGAKINNTGSGVVTVAAHAHLSLKNGAISGGNLSVAAGGVVSADSTYGDAIAAKTFTNQGAVTIGDVDGLVLSGRISNTGEIELNSSGQTARLTIAATGVVLSGGGKVQLSDNTNNTIIGVSGAATLTNTDNTISGAGDLGGDQLTLVNQKTGVIDASGASAALILHTGKTFGDTNAGLIESTGAGGLVITSTAMANTGTVAAAGSGAMIIQGATIVSATAGRVTATAGAHISLKGGGVIRGGTLTVAQGATLTADDAAGNSITGAAFANQGVTAIGNGDGLALAGSITNSGEIQLNSAGAGADLFVGSAGVILSGGGSVVLSDNAFNQVRGYNAPAALTNADNTISGAGRLGGYQLSLDNQAGGVIDATGDTSALTLEVGTSLTATNEGLIESTQAGGLVIESTSLANTGRVEALGPGALTIQTASVANGAGGTVSAASGAHISLKGGGGIAGGLLSIAKGATLTADSAYSNFISVTTFDNAGSVVVGDGDGLTLEGAIANTGVISVNGAGHATTLQVGMAGVTLTGGGQVTFSSNSQNTLVGETAASTLTNVDNHISGGGLLGDGLLTLVNEAGGVISGSGAVALTLDTGANTIVNGGLIEADKGNLTVKSAVANTGALYAYGATLTLAGAVTGVGTGRIEGGTLDAQASFTEAVTFVGGTGTLELADSQAYIGRITGFSLTGGTALDLTDITFISTSATTAKFQENKAGTAGILTVTDGTHTAEITLAGNFSTSTFTTTSDGHGGTKVVDPPAGAGAALFASQAAAMGASFGVDSLAAQTQTMPPAPLLAASG